MTGKTPGTGRRPDGAAFIIAALLIGLGAVLFWDAARLPQDGGYAGVGPASMPRIVGSGLILLGILTAITGYRDGPRHVPPQRIGAVAWIFAGLLLQLLLLKPLGFSIASALLFACTAAAFGKRNLALTLPIGLAFALAIYALFDGVLKLNLPAGWIETTIFGG
ncbi:MAG: tripartite tricarboxylate transporter TctB family protein [Pseudomonadota bacterium]